MASDQSARLLGASMEVDVEASLPRLKKHGELSALAESKHAEVAS